METFTLNDGVVIPSVGFGVFMIPVGDETYNAVRTALSLGYRHIDTAAAYFNEADVGRAIRDSGIPREEIFVTSKLWLQDYGYIDLYLIHQPYGDVPGAWKAMEEAKKEGKIRSIGVSNMTLKIWNSFVRQFDTMPSVNQVECNPLYQQKEIRKLMAEHDVRLEAWYPLGHGDKALLENPVITALAEKYGKNPGQIILRFENQEGFIVLPKSTHEKRIKGNIDIFDFKLTDEEMKSMEALDTGKGHHDPDAPGVAEMLLANFKVHD